MDYGAIVGLIGQVAGVAAGAAASQMDRNEAMRLIKSVSDEYGKINIPQLQKLLLEKQKDTQLAGIKDDPKYRAQQNAADAQLDDVINSGGLTLADRAALNSVRNRISRTESAGRHAIEGGMAARGSLDSGAQLAMELQGNQQSAQSAAEAGEHTSGVAQARAFDAIRMRAQNAGQGLDRDYRQQSDRARAQDAINAGNTAIANTASRYNAGIPQQDFENQMKLTAGKTGSTYALAGANAAQAKDTQQMYQGVGNMAGQAAGKGYDQYKASQQAPANTPNTPGFDQGFGSGGDSGGSSPSDWNQYPGSSDALSGQSTRPQRQVIGYRHDGSPIYGDEIK